MKTHTTNLVVWFKEACTVNKVQASKQWLTECGRRDHCFKNMSLQLKIVCNLPVSKARYDRVLTDVGLVSDCCFIITGRITDTVILSPTD